MSPVHPLYINGHFVEADARGTLPVVNPATDKECAQLTGAKSSDLDAAAKAAGGAYEQWSSTPPEMRAKTLEAMASALEGHLESIANSITLEQGKPLTEAREELKGCAHILRFFADACRNFAFETVIPGAADRHIFETAKGPVLIINTWNFPVEAVISHLAPSLAAGCPSVVLANRVSPGCIVELFRAFDGLGLPNGLINLVMGQSSQIFDELIVHPDITHVSYTGSISVGKNIAGKAGAHLKRATLELGGLAPAIVLRGADILAAAQAFAAKRYWNAGQICTAPNRIYVNKDQYTEFVAAVRDYAESLTVGDGLIDSTKIGPLANKGRVNWMEEIVSDALERGATFVTGQKTADNGGYFWKPTVLADVPEDALGFREEIFGPISLIRSYDDLDMLIETINDCDIGLSGYVFGPDDDEAFSVARRIEVGSVGANQMVTAFTDTPFGGIKQSGLGTVGGASAMREYLFPRSVAVPGKTVAA